MDWRGASKRVAKWTLWTAAIGGGTVIALSLYMDHRRPILSPPHLHARVYTDKGAPVTVERITYKGELLAENMALDEWVLFDLGRWSRGDVFEITVKRPERGKSETRAFSPHPSGTDECLFNVYIDAKAIFFEAVGCIDTD